MLSRAEIERDGQHHPRTTSFAASWPRPPRASRFRSADDDVRAALRQLQRDLPADAARAADDQRDLAAELLLGRHPLQLGFLERPVLDAERLEPRQRHVVVEAPELRRLLGTPRLRHDRRSRLRRLRARSRRPSREWR